MKKGGQQERKDLYTVLGLQGGLDGGAYASSAQIRSAYRAQSLRCHPDKRLDDQATAARDFQALQDAYKVLCDDSKRERYDCELYSSILKGPQIQPPPKRKKKKSQVSGLNLVIKKPTSKPSGASSSVAKAAAISLDELARIKVASGVSGEACERTVCASWNCSAGYDEAKLREALGLFGPIEKIVAPAKNCKKGTGAIVFKFRASASGAVAGFSNDPELKLQMGG
ncbi:dnaJ homolog subfamily C member 17-like [Selaginella moellendorffii]|uniref:dnaJ homolog subfamily C member 17-like n=1 Tax=Selaginella moellendorffii TaxID=88036 RepID=UPI000D1CBC44|nr:dnaJ homolog subfamily C member 17-like [Selaginella moellendorffii]|eukprot:XP_024535806.1 dnaJ homolog subfamily C member 17-like [Selaginella moellendorffii]